MVYFTWRHSTLKIEIAVGLIEAAVSRKSASLIIKDISWLWRIVYNTAIEGCKGWDAFKVAELFSLARRVSNRLLNMLWT